MYWESGHSRASRWRWCIRSPRRPVVLLAPLDCCLLKIKETNLNLNSHESALVGNYATQHSYNSLPVFEYHEDFFRGPDNKNKIKNICILIRICLITIWILPVEPNIFLAINYIIFSWFEQYFVNFGQNRLSKKKKFWPGMIRWLRFLLRL